MSTTIQRRQFTIDDFSRMVDAGILGEDDRVELIDGEVCEMSPIGARHAGLVIRLTSLLSEKLAGRAMISVQNPVILSDITEPQPDLVLLKPRADYYMDSLPRPSDVLIVIEVADTTLEYDRDEKIPRYAEANIPEAWLVDANRDEVLRYSRPATMYQDTQIFRRNDKLPSVVVENLWLDINEIFLLGQSTSS
jgi:Uma2 family endonuclease